MSRHVHVLDVVAHHPVCAEGREDALDRRLHHGHPAPRQAGLVAVVERGDDLLLEEVIESIGIPGVTKLYEAIDRGTVSSLQAKVAGVKLKGEYVVIIAGTES